MSTENGSTIVIDNGTGMVKAGFSGDDAPSAVFPPRVGRPRDKGKGTRDAEIDTYVGDEAYVKRDILSPPSDEPDVINWDDTEKILFHTFYNELRISPEDYNVLITESPFITKINRQRMVETLFEKFNVNGFYTTTSAVLSTITSGRTTSLVFDSGHSCSYAVPVYELNIIKHAVVRNQVAGKCLTRYLQKLLNDKGCSFTTTADIVHVQLIKEGFRASGVDNSCSAINQVKDEFLKTYELPDGHQVAIGSELDKCCEALFDPGATGAKNAVGAHELLQASLMKCDTDLREEMARNIVITGGSTMFKSFPERFKAEFISLLNNSNVNVVSGGNQKYDAWIGGSILASMSFFETMMVSKDEYNEWGPNVVHWKCF